MSSITEIIATEQLIKAIYLTLLHSLWQGAVISGIAGLVMMSGKRFSSSARYNFLTGSMAFFVLCIIVTFVKFSSATSSHISADITSVNIGISSYKEVVSNPIDQLFSALNYYSNRIVLLWFLIICLKSLQLYMGFQGICNLKTKQISVPEPKWNNLVNLLREKLAIRQAVQLLESGITSVPLTVGYLKPVILVPIGMLGAIPADQVEAILLHELAHIKRKDYFINIFHSVVEVLFFFNPAIWWLSSLIRAERENCCDDIAIANSSSKINYVRALVSFEEYRVQHPPIAIAFSGSENTLLKRTRRIIYNQNNTLNSMEKFILTSGLVLSGMLSLAFTNGAKETISKTLKPMVSTISEKFSDVENAIKVYDDTVPASTRREMSIVNGGATTVNAVHKGKNYKIVMNDDIVTDLFVDNSRIAKENFTDYTNDIIEIVQFNSPVKDTQGATGLAVPDQKNTFKSNRFFAAGMDDLRSLSGLDGLTGANIKIATLNALSALSVLSGVADTLVPVVPETPEAPAAPESPETPKFPETPRAPKAAPAPRSVPRPAPSPSPAIKAAPVKITGPGAIKASRFIKAVPIVAPAIEIPMTPALKQEILVAPEADPARDVEGTPAPVKIKHIIIPSVESAQHLRKEIINEGVISNPAKLSYKVVNSVLIIDGVKQENRPSRIISKILNDGQTIEYTYIKR